MAIDAMAKELDWRRGLNHRQLSLDDSAVLCGLALSTLGLWIDGTKELAPAKLARVKKLLRSWRKEDRARGIAPQSFRITLGELRSSLDWVRDCDLLDDAPPDEPTDPT